MLADVKCQLLKDEVMAFNGVTSFILLKDVKNTCKLMRNSPTIGGISSVQWENLQAGSGCPVAAAPLSVVVVSCRSLSGLACGPVSDQSPLSLNLFTGGCRVPVSPVLVDGWLSSAFCAGLNPYNTSKSVKDLEMVCGVPSSPSLWPPLEAKRFHFQR